MPGDLSMVLVDHDGGLFAFGGGDDPT